MIQNGALFWPWPVFFGSGLEVSALKMFNVRLIFELTDYWNSSKLFRASVLQGDWSTSSKHARHTKLLLQGSFHWASHRGGSQGELVHGTVSGLRWTQHGHTDTHTDFVSPLNKIQRCRKPGWSEGALSDLSDLVAPLQGPFWSWWPESKWRFAFTSIWWFFFIASALQMNGVRLSGCGCCHGMSVSPAETNGDPPLPRERWQKCS